MRNVKTLIDMASAKCGTDAALARSIGVSRSNIADMKSGLRPVSPETVAALCDVLQLSGEECREWVAVAIIENPKNSSRAEMLRRAFFALWVLGVGICTSAMNDARALTGASMKTTSAAMGCTDRRYLSLTDGLYIVAHWVWSKVKQPRRPRVVARRFPLALQAPFGWAFGPSSRP